LKETPISQQDEL